MNSHPQKFRELLLKRLGEVTKVLYNILNNRLNHVYVKENQ